MDEIEESYLWEFELLKKLNKEVPKEVDGFMSKYIKKREELEGIDKIINNEDLLPEDLQDQLKKDLSKFKAEKVDAFICSTGLFLSRMKTCVTDIPKHDKKNDLESIFEFFKKDVINNLRSLQHSDVFLSGPENLRTWRVKHIKESHEREHKNKNLLSWIKVYAEL